MNRLVKINGEWYIQIHKDVFIDVSRSYLRTKGFKRFRRTLRLIDEACLRARSAAIGCSKLDHMEITFQTNTDDVSFEFGVWDDDQIELDGISFGRQSYMVMKRSDIA